MGWDEISLPPGGPLKTIAGICTSLQQEKNVAPRKVWIARGRVGKNISDSGTFGSGDTWGGWPPGAAALLNGRCQNPRNFGHPYVYELIDAGGILDRTRM